MEEMLYHAELRTIFSAGNGEVEIYEFNIPTALQGKPVTSILEGNESACLVGLTRAGKAILPNAETILEAGDILLVSATIEGIQGLQQQLKAQEAQP
jgi:trk system potassium uptake protein TrkA